MIDITLNNKKNRCVILNQVLLYKDTEHKANIVLLGNFDNCQDFSYSKKKNVTCTDLLRVWSVPVSVSWSSLRCSRKQSRPRTVCMVVGATGCMSSFSPEPVPLFLYSSSAP